ncbi:MAG: hypothetical protein HYZ74_03040 [Elusimicrobia bacterium]|nr:hypothetical protein [Elusimicrobiota bacterium]
MTKAKWALLAVLVGVPLQAKPRLARPAADALILRALAGPATGYSAVERVQVFLPGAKPKALKALVTALPGRVRREYLTKRKGPGLVQVREMESPEKGLARLRALYEMNVSTGGVVVKRKTWRVDLIDGGVLRRSLWVDRDSGLLLKRETYRPDGSLARRERLVKLALPADVDPASLSAEPAASPWTPDGFFFVGESGGVRRYSNGLDAYTIGPDGAVAGELAEDDAARVRDSLAK